MKSKTIVAIKMQIRKQKNLFHIIEYPTPLSLSFFYFLEKQNRHSFMCVDECINH